MVKRMGQYTKWSATAVAVVCALCSATLVQAASINYGSFGPVAPGISFLNVIESSGTDGGSSVRRSDSVCDGARF